MKAILTFLAFLGFLFWINHVADARRQQAETRWQETLSQHLCVVTNYLSTPSGIRPVYNCDDHERLGKIGENPQ
jgi:hypothetical protein